MAKAKFSTVLCFRDGYSVSIQRTENTQRSTIRDWNLCSANTRGISSGGLLRAVTVTETWVGSFPPIPFKKERPVNPTVDELARSSIAIGRLSRPLRNNIEENMVEEVRKCCARP